MMVVFLPWCPVDKEYFGDGIRLFPYSAAAPIREMDPSEREAIAKVFASYRDLQGQPVSRVALIQYRGRPLTTDLDEAEREEVSEFVELACFAALAKRDLFRERDFYCNRDHFTCYIQSFNEIPPQAVAFETPRGRGAGSLLSGWLLDKLTITVPVHVPLNGKITIDEVLLKALLGFRAKLKGSNSRKKWTQWLSAVECFNHANTDMPSLPYAVEWVLICGAFEQILDAEPDAEVVAEKFAAVLQPPEKFSPPDGFKRNSKKFKGLPLRQEWMREFYRLRGNLAHGWLVPQQPDVAWSVAEHLALARLAFPLVAKVLLERERLYRLTQGDRACISAFEELVDSRFLERPKIPEKDEGDVV